MNNRQLTLCVIFCVLQILLAALKLTHVIAWSWWWVTAPLWGSLALLVILLLLLVVGVVAAAHEGNPI